MIGICRVNGRSVVILSQDVSKFDQKNWWLVKTYSLKARMFAKGHLLSFKECFLILGLFFFSSLYQIIRRKMQVTI